MSAEWMRSLQVMLSAVAGFVDAIGYLALSGVYLAFMSGNSTLLGIAGGTWMAESTWLSAAAIACFLAGVVLGTLTGTLLATRRSRPIRRIGPAGVLLLVAALIAGAALLSRQGMLVAGGLVLAAAMGMKNTVFNRPGYSGVGLTYMTGTLVRVGQRLAEAVSGGAWRAVAPDLLLWLGLVIGAGLGAVAFHALGLDGLWIAVGGVVLVAGLSVLVTPAREPAKAA